MSVSSPALNLSMEKDAEEVTQEVCKGGGAGDNAVVSEGTTDASGPPAQEEKAADGEDDSNDAAANDNATLPPEEDCAEQVNSVADSAPPSPQQSASGDEAENEAEDEESKRSRSPSSSKSQKSRSSSPSRTPASPSLQRGDTATERKRSRTPARVSRPYGTGQRPYGGNPPGSNVQRKPGEKAAVCWYGWNCKREKCWYDHPEGRRIDQARHGPAVRPWAEKSGAGNRPPVHGNVAPKRTFRRTDERRRSRSPTRDARRSRSPLRRGRSRSVRKAGRSASRASRSYSPVSRSKSPASAKSASPLRGGQEATRGKQREAKPAAVPVAKGNSQAVPLQSAGPVQPKSRTMTFREFVMELDNETTATDAAEEYKGYLRRQALETYQKMRPTGIAYDLYHPWTQMRRYDLRICNAQRAAQDFVAKGAEILAGNEGEMNPNKNALIFDRIPKEVSLWDIYDVLQMQQGFVASSLQLYPTRGTMLRQLRARFITTEAARAAQDALVDVELRTSGHRLCPKLVDEPIPDLPPARALPVEMHDNAQIEKDVQLAANVIKQLDGLMAIPSNVTQAILTLDVDAPLRKLDLQVLYLRRVHRFCFYSAVQNEDDWELVRRCGQFHMRSSGELPPAAGAEKERSSTQAHESRISDFLQAVGQKLSKPHTPGLDDARFLTQFATKSAEKTVKVGEGKFQCSLCAKLFKGPEYVTKHIRKTHEKVVEDARRFACEQVQRTAFVEDPKRPDADQ